MIAVDSLAAHQLEINEIYCRFKYRPLPGSALFIRWVSFQEPIARKLIPDGYGEIRTPSKLFACFIEVDRGTEGSSVWQGKVEAHAASGSFVRDFHQPHFLTLQIRNRV